jgi:hypothetical protein
MICQRIYFTGTDSAIAQPHNDQCSFDEDFLDYVLEELITQANNSFNHLCSILLLLKLICDSQLFCRWVGLP